jgi:hypothetical protein
MGKAMDGPSRERPIANRPQDSILPHKAALPQKLHDCGKCFTLFVYEQAKAYSTMCAAREQTDG